MKKNDLTTAIKEFEDLYGFMLNNFPMRKGMIIYLISPTEVGKVVTFSEN